MKMMTIGEFKTHFSEVIEQLKAGEEILVTYGNKKEVVGYFMPQKPQKLKRQLGILEGKVKVISGPDFEMTEEELLNYGLPT